MNRTRIYEEIESTLQQLGFREKYVGYDFLMIVIQTYVESPERRSESMYSLVRSLAEEYEPTMSLTANMRKDIDRAWKNTPAEVWQAVSPAFCKKPPVKDFCMIVSDVIRDRVKE